MRVEVYWDVVCPWCRIGAGRFDRAVAAAGFEVEQVYRPFQLDPDRTGPAVPYVQVVGERYGHHQVARMTAEMTKLGASEGLEFRFDQALAINTFDAHRLMWFASREGDATVRSALTTALFDAHFRDGGDISDHEQLAVLAERSGLPGAEVRSFLASPDGVAEVREELADARRRGITAVPTYIFENGLRLQGARSSEEILAALRHVHAAAS